MRTGSLFGAGVVPQPITTARPIHLMRRPYRMTALVATQDPHKGRQGAGEGLGGIADEQADAAPVEALDTPELEAVRLAPHQVSSRRELDELGPGPLRVVQTRQRRIVAHGGGGEKPLAVHGAGRSHAAIAREILNEWEGLNV